MDSRPEKPKYLPPQIWIPVLTSAICLAVVFVLWGLEKGSPPASTNSKIPIEQYVTANWKTYRNEEYGFEIKYPWDFNLHESGSLISFSGSNGGLRVNIGCYAHGLEGLHQEVKNIRFLDLEAHEYVYKDDTNQIIEVDIGFERNDKCHAIEMFPSDSVPLEVLRQILSTFKFIGPTASTDQIFDACGSLEKYKTYSWHGSFEKQFRALNLEFFSEEKDFGISEVCYSKIKGLVILATQPILETDVGKPKIFRYNISDKQLQEASYIGDPKKLALVFGLQFGKREGNIIPASGGYGDAGCGFTNYFDYNFVQNTFRITKGYFSCVNNATGKMEDEKWTYY